MNKMNFEKQTIRPMKVKTEGNLKLIQNKKNVSCNVTQLQPVIISLSEIEILSSTPY
jgi:hypothetical protein